MPENETMENKGGRKDVGNIIDAGIIRNTVDIPSSESIPSPENPFPMEKEYIRSVTALNRIGILTILPKSETVGVLGIDGKEYPLPTLEQVNEIFKYNSELVKQKLPQGFNRLELTPMAMPTSILIDRLKTSILKHEKKGQIYQTRATSSDPTITPTPIQVDTEKPVYIWDTPNEALDTDGLIYFPQEYSQNHKGLTKQEVINNPKFCAIPGWSIGLVEDMPILPQQGKGQTLDGRKQLETNMTPHNYLKTLQTQAYRGETGKTIEDFITKFLTHLNETNEISHDWNNNNALWLLGQSLKEDGSVANGRWTRGYRRVYLITGDPDDSYEAWGASSTVRLLKP